MPTPVGDSARVVDAVVLGAGVSGLVSTSILQQQGSDTVVILDEYDHIGGNHIDRSIGDYTYDIGSLIFQDDSPLLGHFPEILPLYVPIEPTWARLNPQGVVTHYPFSIKDDVISAGPSEMLRMTVSFLWGRLSWGRLGWKRRKNVRDFSEHLLGARFVQRSGLGIYMERLCGRPPEEIDLEFAQTRLLWLQDQARLRNLLRRAIRTLTGDPEPPSFNRQLARPREGFSRLYAPAVDKLRSRGAEVRLGGAIESIKRHGEHFELSLDEGSIYTRRVVSTIPLDRTLQLCGIDVTGFPLPTVTLVSLFFSFHGDRGFETAILYNFSREGAWKRITMYSDFYDQSGSREYFTVEVIGERVDNSVVSAEADFRAHCSENGLFTGDLRLEGSNVLESAYPIYTDGSGQRAREGIRALRSFGLESLGRQGGFQYQPTSRASTVEAEQVLRHRAAG